MNNNFQQFAATALAFFIIGLAFLFLFLVLFDMNPRDVLFPSGAGRDQGLVFADTEGGSADTRPAGAPVDELEGPMYHEADSRVAVASRERSADIDDSRDNAIIRAIREGRQPVGMTSDRLKRHAFSPIWTEQRDAFAKL